MARKKKMYIPQPFESMGKTFIDSNGKLRADTCATIYESMLLSVAWRSLKPRERQLYLYCKSQLFGKRKPSKDFPDVEQFQSDLCFYLNLGAVVGYGIYKRSGNKEFYGDMKTLIDRGFIECLSSGKYTKSKSIYKLSEKWQKWNGETFD